MNLTPDQLARQYQVARNRAGELIDSIESEFSIPPRLLYAIASRETNCDPYYLNHAGDGGHGRGWWQVDDRSHAIPDDWATNIEWQCRRGSEILAACLASEGGNVVRAANRYNSGQGETRYTTGRDYGPDVYDRWQFLVENFPPVSSPSPQANDKWTDVFVPILVGE